MEPRHQVSRAGLELIKRFEGLRRRAARLPEGGYTVGYGHTRSAREGAEVDEADAEALLRYDLQPIEGVVNAAVFTPLTQNQYDALVAFAFSVGPDTFRRSNVVRRVNEGDLLGAAAALESWRRAEFEGEVIVVDALIRRRAAEKALFLTPTDGFVASPSTVLRPQMDFGAPAVRQPASAASDIITPLDGDAVTPSRTTDPATEFPLDAEPSPAQAAAASVSRRLQALFAEEPAPEPAESPERPPELATDPALNPFAAAEAEPRRGLIEVLAVPPTPAPSPANESEPSFDRRLAAHEPSAASVTAQTQKEATGPYLVLGLIGLAAFVMGVWLILQGQQAGETDVFGRRSAIGSVLGLIGIGAFCTAVYEWLKVLGRNGDGQSG